MIYCHLQSCISIKCLKGIHHNLKIMLLQKWHQQTCLTQVVTNLQSVKRTISIKHNKMKYNKMGYRCTYLYPRTLLNLCFSSNRFFFQSNVF